MVDAVAGFGDATGFGLSAHILDPNGIGGIDTQSSNYPAGRIADIAVSIGTTVPAGTAVNIGIHA